jgi:hypothetical protein
MKDVLAMRSFKEAAVEFRKSFPGLLDDLPHVENHPDVIREQKELDRLDGIVKEVTRRFDSDIRDYPTEPAAATSVEDYAEKYLAGTPIDEMPNVTPESQKRVLLQIKKGIEQKRAAQEEKLMQTKNRVKREMCDAWKQWYIDEIVKPEISALKQLNKILQKKVVADGEFNRAGLDEGYRPGIVTTYERALLKGGQLIGLSSLGGYIENNLCNPYGLDEEKIK